MTTTNSVSEHTVMAPNTTPAAPMQAGMHNPDRKSVQGSKKKGTVLVADKTGKTKMFQRKKLGDILKQAIENGTKPVRLYGNLLFKGETLVVFAAPNQGKSLLAVEIGIRCSGGPSRNPGYDDCEEICPTDIIDCELNDTQFANRYAQYHSELDKLPINRVSFTPGDGDVAEELASYIKMRQAAENPPKLFIIDNVTALTNGCPSAVKTTRILNKLKHLKETFGLTFIIVAHTAKGNGKKPLAEDSLGGSRQLANFADAMVAIGCGKNTEIKYIKIVKARSCSKPAMVDVMEITDDPYVGFDFICKANEDELLDGSFTLSIDDPQLEAQILMLYKEVGLTADEIANDLGLSHTAVNSYLNSNSNP